MVITMFIVVPILTDINTKQVRAKITVWPAKMLANRRTVSAKGFEMTPKSSITGIRGIGNFIHTGTSGHKISFQYSLLPKTFTANIVAKAITRVTAILPVVFAPPGKAGTKPIRLFTKMK